MTGEPDAALAKIAAVREYLDSNGYGNFVSKYELDVFLTISEDIAEILGFGSSFEITPAVFP